MIKVIWIALVVVLQIMKITQEIERERRRGLVGHCGEPASAKDLCVLALGVVIVMTFWYVLIGNGLTFFELFKLLFFNWD